jgi:hypothetical protein
MLKDSILYREVKGSHTYGSEGLGHNGLVTENGKD